MFPLFVEFVIAADGSQESVKLNRKHVPEVSQRTTVSLTAQRSLKWWNAATLQWLRPKCRMYFHYIYKASININFLIKITVN